MKKVTPEVGIHLQKMWEIRRRKILISIKKKESSLNWLTTENISFRFESFLFQSLISQKCCCLPEEKFGGRWSLGCSGSIVCNCEKIQRAVPSWHLAPLVWGCNWSFDNSAKVDLTLHLLLRGFCSCLSSITCSVMELIFPQWFSLVSSLKEKKNLLELFYF